MNKLIELWKSLPSWAKHVIVAFSAGIFTKIILLILDLRFQDIQIQLSAMAFLVWMLIIIKWEMSQRDRHPITYNWKDGAMDLLIGAVCFALPLFIGNPALHWIF